MYEHIPQTLIFICQPKWQSGTWLFLVRNNPDTNLQTDKFCCLLYPKHIMDE